MHDARIVALLDMRMNDFSIFSVVAHGPEKDLRDVKEDEHCILNQKQKKNTKTKQNSLNAYVYIYIYLRYIYINSYYI